MRILQLGKFYPIKGGVEKVEYDLTTGPNMERDCRHHDSAFNDNDTAKDMPKI